jgi:hypothetical protein
MYRITWSLPMQSRNSNSKLKDKLKAITKFKNTANYVSKIDQTNISSKFACKSLHELHALVEELQPPTN